MGDKSPKSKQKNQSQKQTKTDANAKAKRKQIADKQSPAKSATPLKK